MAAAPASAAVSGGALPLRDRLGFFALVVGMFMAILDIQIVASSLAEIQAGVSAGPEEISWVQTGYLIAEVVMIPLSGWLSRLMSTRWLFTMASGGFTIASGLCAIAWNLESLVAFRVVQGFLGGAMIPTVFAAAFALFPGKKQAGVSVVIGLVATCAPALGPTIGGHLTEALSWHWLFLLNLPVGAAVTVAAATLVHFDEADPSLLRRIDLIGIGLVAVCLGSLQYILEEGPRDDWFDSAPIVFFTACAAIGGVLLVWRELTAKDPVVDLRAFLDRNFVLGCLYSFITGVGLYGAVYLMPLFLARVRDLNPAQIGEVVMITGLFQFLSAPLAGALSRKLDLRVMLSFGLLMFALGLWLNTHLTHDWDYWEFFLPQAVRGVSLMFIFIPINRLSLGTLPKEKLGNASGLYNLMRNLGGAIGLAAITTMLTDQTKIHYSYLAENVTTARLAAEATLSGMERHFDPVLGSSSAQAALGQVRQIVMREATVMAFADVFTAVAVVFAFGLLLMPFVHKVGGNGPDGGGH
ncbi:DHA2 family efflux MFS transporter permease subunit [Rhodospirillum rubrum]|uniref:Drug resistance transporter EmrB/QacA subfamily n=1 Tax=Rhodospirillum rubrum (strain ATCC 11170 / ATH 1.1.1 / DSM 467 / LMG 4362 / NCIMB 8255 / S1) TaxID=269796 RepID=Q2RY33_RHORT|nr:DHA2 family efflux MFS transporter permease subunit [Rhodospirillum rubrum]ABC20962.1 Drug resistance transporter EmrB/QacA subfamily [Rhodospirillum rubrum ATCC 11170]AEO46629.1 EmrB/QacA family drug resistance transporter [Rhodospirillum rubrum F11]MBK5952519.1 MFS transporter [Rhodospirillum rubrum]QXG80661.1 DHA2 family efflux MFS transporter permease subunit [Rhodospirillum rubrum]HCF19267.1 MFS transporter [Rhodospirillum rubrum]